MHWQLRHQTPKRRISVKVREDRCAAAASNKAWAMGFLPDGLFDVRRIHILTIINA